MAIFTEEILNQGKSRNGFWSNAQLYALGLTEIKKGWKHLVLGKEIADEGIQNFLNLKDKHLSRQSNVTIDAQPNIEMNLPEGEQDLITLTEEMILQGQSVNGGWSGVQLRVLGAEPFEKGWKIKIVGSKFPRSTIDRFISLKNQHLTKQKQSERTISYDSMSVVNKDLRIEEQYTNQSWIDLKKKVLLRDNYTCKICEAKNTELHVHHLEYPKGKFIWEIDSKYLVVVCKECHEKIHDKSFDL